MVDGTSLPRAAIGIWQVQPGDNFWSMAEQILTDAYLRAPTRVEHSTYWAQLVAANRYKLVRVDDANTILPGQSLDVILPAPPHDTTLLFDNQPPAALTITPSSAVSTPAPP